MSKSVSREFVQDLIFTVRDERVILDADLAALYGVETKRLNEQVRRNAERFPDDFAFRLTREELTELRSQNATFRRRHYRYLPYAFTEHGSIMAANILISRKAVDMSVFVVRAFVRIRQELLSRMELEKRLDQIEKILLVHDDSLKDLYQKIRPLLLPPEKKGKRKLGFQVDEKKARYRLDRKSRTACFCGIGAGAAKSNACPT